MNKSLPFFNTKRMKKNTDNLDFGDNPTYQFEIQIDTTNISGERNVSCLELFDFSIILYGHFSTGSQNG